MSRLCQPDPPPAPSAPCGLRGSREHDRGSGVQGGSRPARGKGPAVYPRAKEKLARGPCRQKPGSLLPGRRGLGGAPPARIGVHTRTGQGEELGQRSGRAPLVRPEGPAPWVLALTLARHDSRFSGPRWTLLPSLIPQIPAPHVASGPPVCSCSSFTLSPDRQTSPLQEAPRPAGAEGSRVPTAPSTQRCRSPGLLGSAPKPSS